MICIVHMLIDLLGLTAFLGVLLFLAALATGGL